MKLEYSICCPICKFGMYKINNAISLCANNNCGTCYDLYVDKYIFNNNFYSEKEIKRLAKLKAFL